MTTFRVPLKTTAFIVSFAMLDCNNLPIKWVK